jgi:outer membrane receptor protein involved in Fe transport
LHVPVLKGLPGVKSLDLDLGGRYSDYSSFGTNTSGKMSLEYRPYSDLLVRATYNDVFRAPTTTELFQGALQGSPPYADPCAGLTQAQLDAINAVNPVACKNVAAGYQQPVSQANGNTIGNPGLQGEKGYATDFGLVFDPSFYKPLSVSVDYWMYSLKQAIDSVDINTILNGCFNSPSSAYCGDAPNGLPYFTRAASGDVVNSYEPFVNANRYKVNGIDTSIKLNYPSVNVAGYNIGRVQVGLDTTYLMMYDLKIFDPFSGALVSDYSEAGQYDSNTGNSFPRFKMQGNLFWSKGPYSVAVADRFIGNLRENQVDGAEVLFGVPCNNTTVKCYHNTGSANYVDLFGTYTVKSLNSDFTVGITDLFDDQAQQMYNAALAGAANPIYDVRGRSFVGRITMRFK